MLQELELKYMSIHSWQETIEKKPHWKTSEAWWLLMEEQTRRPVGSIAYLLYNGRASCFLIRVPRQPLLQAEQKRWGDVAPP